MTSFQEAEWATQRTCPPMPPSFRQTAVWDESQRVGLATRMSDLQHRSIFNNPYAQTQPHRDLTAQLRILQRHYVIVGNDRSVSELLEMDSTLFLLLTEAVQPLSRAFGDSLLRIRVQNVDDDSLLKVAVQIPADCAAPEMALQSFDSEWWINNCHRSTGTLVFDYELQDAV